jgi:SSS family solute:Na+ symporter
MVSTTVALAVTVAVLATVTGLGVWYTRGRVESVEDLLVARGSAGRGTTTATLVASVMGVWILTSAPEAGAAFGGGGVAAALGYGVGEALPLLAYARIGPRIRELVPEGHSITEYALARYGRAMYAFVLLVSLFYMFVFLAAELTSIALALELVAGVPRWQTAVLVGGFVLLYTTYGGLRASIVTDTLQTLVVLPLLALGVAGVVASLGGTAAVHEGIAATSPHLLDPGFVDGLLFGVWVSLAILGAELVNQSWWQRVYAARDPASLGRAFAVAALASGAAVFLGALLGVIARGHADVVVAGADYNASVAFFVLLTETFPSWLVLAVVLLALMLVMSTADTLLNAVASLVTADLPRLLGDPDDRTLRLGARVLTVAVALAALFVSLRATSVLGLFLVADLLGAATMVPLLAGLYTRRLSGGGALASALAGVAVGVTFYPRTGPFAPLPGALPAPLPDPAYLPAFAGAAGVSAGLTLLATRVVDARFDLARLSAEIRSLDARADGGDRQ